ncbi:dihydrolipoamide acetyltransferase family protein [uncultured Streptomyces sp.]|uniref:dihydrolipoamide acetyltransferase family protein n=1 Tax=uncultured Streptomyces sp. TaxID=174707 RepID=UPI0026279D88|nr:dihydrolipoamide acetyltransferase family protein [uncultured Streptomyces sp.]
MPQVLEFRLPDLGEGLTEAEIVRWLVEVGEVVAVDQPVVEVETAKAVVEVPCPYGGVVTARFGEAGAELPVGAPLLTVAVAPSEDVGPPVPARTAATGGSGQDGGRPAADTEADAASEGSGNVLVGYGTGAPAARRRRVRPDLMPLTPANANANADGDVDADAKGGAARGALRAEVAEAAGRHAPGALQEGRGATAPKTGHPTARASQGPVAVVSPLVRRLARQHDLDLRTLSGSGPDGLILRADVERAIRMATAVGGPEITGVPGVLAPEPVSPQHRSLSSPHRAVSPEHRSASPEHRPADTAGRGNGAVGERIALRGVRGAVAEKLTRSRSEIPDATCWVDADATEFMAVRAAMNRTDGPKVSVLALLARICTAALGLHPELNSTVDTTAREIVRLPGVNLGFAAQTPRGLVVPVVRDAHLKNAESIGAELARLTEAARTGTLTPAELTGGTFTLNNYGVFGVDGSTPIINHPEAAMLGVGRIIPKPWVHEGEVAVRQVVQLSLTFDHRVCDGGTAGGFLRYVADCVEQPAVLLRTL